MLIREHIILIIWYYHFGGYDKTMFLNAVMGYKELINPEHYDALIERDAKALEIFKC